MMTGVTQADRDALCDILGVPRGWASPDRDGHPELERALPILARHRLASTAQVEALTAERDALRGKVAEVADHFEEKANEAPYGPAWAPLRYAANKVRAALASTSEGEG